MRDLRGFDRRKASKSVRFGHIERLESRAVLSAENALMPPPLMGPSEATAAVAVTQPAITATSNLSATSATSATTANRPVAAVGLRLTIAPQARAGVPTPVTAFAIDAAGRPVRAFTGSVAVSSSDTAANLPLIPISFKNGRASFSVTFDTAGTQSVKVTSLADPAMTATASTSVAGRPMPSSFIVNVPRRVDAGATVNVSITAVDAAKRPIQGFNGTATLTSSDPAATLPASVSFVNGRATARVTFSTPGSQTITARGGAAGNISATATTEVVAAPIAAGFSVVLPKAAAIGVSVPVTIVAIDFQGRPMPRYTGTATLASSDSAAKLPSSVSFIGGRAATRVTFGTLGEQTLTVTSDPALGGGISGSAKTEVGEVVTQRIRSFQQKQ
jgi:hypothetical protein